MERIVALLKERQNILLLPHENPDGDALGSCYALQMGLMQLGKHAYVQLEEEALTPRLAFLAEGCPPMPKDFVPDCVMAMDCGEQKMLKTRAEQYPQVDICLDHHRSGDGFGQVNVVDPSAAATGELTFDLLKRLGVTIDKAMARCLYVALASDTGCFKFSNTTDRSFMMAAELYRVYGAFDAINYRLFTQCSKKELEIRRYIMETLEYEENGKVASIAITQQMRQLTGAGEDDIGGFAQLPRSIEGVEVGITYKEQPDGNWKISMRSNAQIDVSAICSQLGGGGHIRASGCSAEGTLEEAKKTVMAVVRAALKGGNG